MVKVNRLIGAFPANQSSHSSKYTSDFLLITMSATLMSVVHDAVFEMESSMTTFFQKILLPTNLEEKLLAGKCEGDLD